MNLDKLTPAPWWCYTPSEFPHDIRFAWGNDEIGGYLFRLTHSHSRKFSGSEGGAHNNPKQDDAEFIALARQAFDVMMKRGWNAVPDMNQWAVGPAHAIPDALLNMRWSDPFTALVEADKWYREHIEENQKC